MSGITEVKCPECDGNGVWELGVCLRCDGKGTHQHFTDENERNRLFLSIPLRDGSRLELGDCFVVLDHYPFFHDGEENYNAQLLWDDKNKSMWWDVYPVSDRVRGGACGGNMDEIPWDKIVLRPPR